jgi:hypothetical protein
VFVRPGSTSPTVDAGFVVPGPNERPYAVLASDNRAISSGLALNALMTNLANTVAVIGIVVMR